MRAAWSGGGFKPSRAGVLGRGEETQTDTRGKDSRAEVEAEVGVRCLTAQDFQPHQEPADTEQTVP